MSGDSERSREILGEPGLAWMVDRIADRVERSKGLQGTLRKRDPTEQEVDAYARLFGEFPRGGALAVSVARLEEIVVAATGASSLAEAVEHVRGPLRDRVTESEAERGHWDRAFAGLRDERPAVRAEWDELRRSGVVRRLVGGDPDAGTRLMESAAALVRRLPADGVPLAELAAQVTGDAHALDLGRPLGTVGLRLAGAVSGCAEDDRREGWAQVGVELDPLSSSVLVLGLTAAGDGLVSRLLGACREAGEPMRLTLRQLRRDAVVLTDPVVYVCENPAVVLAAASRLGARSRALVCTEGFASTAVMSLLAAAGERVRYHGDFDWPGLQIAARVIGSSAERAWRFDAASYRAAAKGVALQGRRTESPWDPTLAEAMSAEGRAVHEEAVLDALLGDLER